MKIAHLFINFPNNYQKYNIKLIERLQKNHVENIVFTFKKNEGNCLGIRIIEIRQSKIKRFIQIILNFNLIISFKNKFKYSLKKAFRVYSKFYILSVENYDVLHIHHIQTLSQDLLNYISFFDIKVVVTFRGSDILIRPYRSKVDFDFINNIFKSISFAHTVSDNLKKELKKFNISQEKIFSIKRTPEKFTKISLKKEEIFNITSIGRVHWTKGYIPTLLALSWVKNNSNKEFKYNICGSGNSESLDELKCWIRNLNLEDNIILHGYLNDVEIDSILSITNLYLQPSVSEGIPNTLLRALQSEIPILASDVGGVPEVINEDNGLLFNYKDFDGFKKQILRFLNLEVDIEKFRFNDFKVNENFEVKSYKKMYSLIKENSK